MTPAEAAGPLGQGREHNWVGQQEREGWQSRTVFYCARCGVQFGPAATWTSACPGAPLAPAPAQGGPE